MARFEDLNQCIAFWLANITFRRAAVFACRYSPQIPSNKPGAAQQAFRSVATSMLAIKDVQRECSSADWRSPFDCWPNDIFNTLKQGHSSRLIGERARAGCRRALAGRGLTLATRLPGLSAVTKTKTATNASMEMSIRGGGGCQVSQLRRPASRSVDSSGRSPASAPSASRANERSGHEHIAGRLINGSECCLLALLGARVERKFAPRRVSAASAEAQFDLI